MTKRGGKHAGNGGGEVSATRGEIQEAAKRLIALQGFTGTTVRQIARNVRMKGGSLLRPPVTINVDSARPKQG